MIQSPAIAEVPHDYLELLLRFPLRRLKDEADLDAAIAVLKSLMMRPEESLSDGEGDYFGTLTLLIHEYESREHPTPPDDRPPLERLRELVEESEIPAADLDRLLGGASAAVLAGTRELTAADVRRLSDHYHLSPHYFL